MGDVLIGTVVTGSLGIAALLISKFKCICEVQNCKMKTCKIGVIESNIVDDHEIEYKKINLNANDILYMSKNTMKNKEPEEEKEEEEEED
jgi:hypothetical protein